MTGVGCPTTNLELRRRLARLAPAIAIAMMIAGPGARPVSAHRLDEYVQATRLGLSRGRIVVDLSLTPGAQIAAQLFDLIDLDGSGAISPDETRAYVRRVIADMTLIIDGRALPLTVARAVTPAWDEMSEGVGTIRVEAFAANALTDDGNHQIVFENRHQPAPSVYLVNALKPDEGEIAIHAQRRDTRQHRIELDVEVTGPRSRTLWMAWAFTLLVGLITVRRRNHVGRAAREGGDVRMNEAR
jgi:hypothetical protein